MQTLVSETLAGPFHRRDNECTEKEGTLVKFKCQLPLNTKMQIQANEYKRSSSRQPRQRTVSGTWIPAHHHPLDSPACISSLEALNLLVFVLSPQTQERTALELTVEKL